MTHYEGNLYQLKRDVALIDQAYCSLDLLLKQIERDVARGYSRIDVNPRRARNLLKQIEREVNNLSNELVSIKKLAYKPAPQTYRQPVPKPVTKHKGYNSNYRPYNGSRNYSVKNTTPYKVNRSPYDRTALSFSIGGGSTQFRIGF